MDKINETLKFYRDKLLTVINSALDNVIKTVEVVLGKVPQLIEDVYDLVKANITVTNGVALVIIYAVYENFEALLKDPITLAISLVAVVMLFDKFKLK